MRKNERQALLKWKYFPSQESSVRKYPDLLARIQADHAFASSPTFSIHDTLLNYIRRTGSLKHALVLRKQSKYILQHCRVPGNFRFSLTSMVINLSSQASNIEFGNDVVSRGIVRVEKQGQCKVGNRVYIGDRSLISVHRKLEIGDNVLISHGVFISDNDSHPKSTISRRAHIEHLLGSGPKFTESIDSQEILIENDCWIGAGSIILKGTQIGSGSIVGAGAVVKGNFPENSLILPALSTNRVINRNGIE